MTVLETVGLAWVIFTSTLATIAVVYLAFIGAKALMGRYVRDSEVPVEVKEMFKIMK
jgi:hypothetical protein